MYSKLLNVNIRFLDSFYPETLCLHSVACCTHRTEELDQYTREIPYGGDVCVVWWWEPLGGVGGSP